MEEEKQGDKYTFNQENKCYQEMKPFITNLLEGKLQKVLPVDIKDVKGMNVPVYILGGFQQIKEVEQVMGEAARYGCLIHIMSAQFKDAR